MNVWPAPRTQATRVSAGSVYSASPYEHEREVIDLLDYLHDVLPAAG